MRTTTFAVCAALLAGACAVHTPPATTSPRGRGYVIQSESDLRRALEAANAVVEPAGYARQAFLRMPGDLLRVDGVEVQVYEYASEPDRDAVSATISPDGYRVGAADVTWVAPPTFWARGSLLVIKVGAPDRVADLLTSLLGPPIAGGQAPPVTAPPSAAQAARSALAQSLDVPEASIRVVRSERAEWPDSCLGLGQTDEVCAQVMTPGWNILLLVDGRYYELRTDDSGAIVRSE